MGSALGVSLPATLDALAPPTARATKLAALQAAGSGRRPDQERALAITLRTTVKRHKPSTAAQYDVSRRLVARWLRAEAPSTGDFAFAAFRLHQLGLGRSGLLRWHP